MKHTENDNFPGGILAINKPQGMTSHDVVNKIRRIYNTKRVGHAGTLDPLAEGVLVVLVGRAAKACEYISSDSKKYTATLRLGVTTDTEDITGEILTENDNIPTPDKVQPAVQKMQGRIMQVPPMYSALKVNGQKLYDLARQGIEVERQAREIEIFEISCMPTEDAREYILSVHCTGGTYIRTLCADIGKGLGCGGVMKTLRRDEACGIMLCDAKRIEEVEKMSFEERQEVLMPTEKLFEDCPAVTLSPFFEKLFRSGCPIYQHKIGVKMECGTLVRVCGEKCGFFALGETVLEPDGDALRSVKIFSL